jgi:putative endonuclease
MFYIYILKSKKSGSYYKGQTVNLERRIREHNNGEEKSTSRYVPWVLVWHTIVGSRSEALALEQKLKNMTGAKRIEDFIKRHSTN